jgi:hypothetical protein
MYRVPVDKIKKLLYTLPIIKKSILEGGLFMLARVVLIN